MRRALVLSGIVVSFASGYWLRGQSDVQVVGLTVPTTPGIASPSGPTVEAALKPLPSPEHGNEESEAGLQEALRQLADARAELAFSNNEQARLRLELSQTDRTNSKTKPISPPPDLPTRFGAEAFRSTVTAALKEVGGKSAQLTEMDCTEYPCIAYGRDFGGKEAFERLETASSMQEYKDDSRNAFGFNIDGRQYFGLAMTPSDAASESPEFEARIRERMQEMQASYAQPAKHKQQPPR